MMNGIFRYTSTIPDQVSMYYIGNQLQSIVNRGSLAGNYTHDANGNMTLDGPNYLNLEYNVLNLTGLTKDYSTHSVKATYRWTADGTKAGVKDASGANGFEYLGSLIYQRTNGIFQLESASFSGGRILQTSSGAQVNYFITDHLGSTRVVVDNAGNVVERNDFYPFGKKHANSALLASTNRFHFTNYEDQTTGGIGYMDAGARFYYGIRFTTPDPLAKINPSISPYAYCKNNPINRIDPTGMLDDDIYYNSSGMIIQKVTNDKPDRNFVIKTAQTTEEMYGKGERGKSHPISSEAATMTESEIASGNLTGDHMSNVVQIKDTRSMKAMLNSIGDDGTGGTNPANNREYSGSFGGENGVYSLGKSASGNPRNGAPLVTSGENEFHSHASGQVRYTENGQAMAGAWQQPPSSQDISVAGTKNEYVVGMRSGTIYIYNKQGVIATIPISTFK